MGEIVLPCEVRVLLHKVEAPENFSFGNDRGTPISPRVVHLGEEVFRFQIRSRLWKSSGSHAVLDEKAFAGPVRSQGHPSRTIDGNERAELRIDDRGGLQILFEGSICLRTAAEQGFGLCGKKWVMVFDCQDDMHFYGMGEKHGSLEKSGVRTRFWNTDVFSDFPKTAVYEANTDPLYVSIPYLLLVRPGFAVGILLDNPYSVFMNIAAVEDIAQVSGATDVRRFSFGAPDGKPVIYFIVGKSAAEVTRKYQRLCGPTPLPPLWALGHQQCRWGYRSEADLLELARNFRRYQIPNDGLWLDIDYMDGFRIFTFDSANFDSPAKQIESLTDDGWRVCPILDPGVRAEPGYEVYDSGVDRDLFCLTSEDRPFVGFVWPGRTVFPDFSLAETRSWWADMVSRFAETGIAGVWIDMNDPSTGSADYEEMRFGHGKSDHASYHNQYALGMQIATRAGLLQAHPNERPFVVSRSGFVSTGRYSAIWTGDNVSNYVHLAQSIPVCLNLSLSGIPFVGADVGGFGLECTPSLLVDWYKAAFLFPFFRNHSEKWSSRQEPWAKGARARLIITHYIRLRYKLLPYLYSLFVAQANSGAPILRPLFLEFPDGGRNDLSRVQDQFMVGPGIMQAPFIEEGCVRREVLLPPGLWYDPAAGGWVRGNRRVLVQADPRTTPLFFREGSVVPMLRGEPRDNRSDLSSIELHLFISRRSNRSAENPVLGVSHYDDGRTFDFRNGDGQSILRAACWVEKDRLTVDFADSQMGYGPMRVELHVYDSFRDVCVRLNGEERPVRLRPYRWNCCNARIECLRSEPITIDLHNR
ncbi:MAG TPA: glycoside hydrolase family 31 protein [Spirochaetia bacterium]|nr:glycoside hydrolase family 31 protein [Spirochaetia bacterium]